MGKTRNWPESLLLFVDEQGNVELTNTGPRAMTVSVGDGMTIKLRPGQSVTIAAHIARHIAETAELPWQP